nr:AIPR family protein [Aminobacter aminovorans]
MKAQDLEYVELLKIVKQYIDKGRPVSIAFLNWFLEHIYRLEQVTAEDAICDKNNDRGIDGIYVNDEKGEVHIFQSKTKQKGTIGDKDIREFSGTINQIRTPDALKQFLDGKVDNEIKDKISGANIPDLLAKGYKIKGVFVTNVPLDANGKDALSNDPDLIGYDSDAIVRSYVDLNVEGGIKSKYEFESDGEPLLHQAGPTKVVVCFAAGAQLANMPGIDDGSLFELNVRLPLGSTKVNKAIRESIENNQQHRKFALFHNGVTILAENVETVGETITLTNFVVVNGAQSLKQFHSAAGKITDDLRVLTRIIEIGGDAELAREISINSNNQNGIKARDLRSNDILQIRLQSEFGKLGYEGFQFDVKRGDEGTGNVISNEYAGKLLLAFDLEEPWSCHQTYKVFDEKYADIFGRPGVNAQRIIFLHKVMELIEARLPEIENVPFAHYGLTQYALLAAVKRLLNQETLGQSVCQRPEDLFDKGNLNCVLGVIDDLLKSIIIDTNHEVRSGQLLDYKSDLKSRTSVTKLLDELVRSYQKDKARGKVDDLQKRLTDCKVI